MDTGHGRNCGYSAVPNAYYISGRKWGTEQGLLLHDPSLRFTCSRRAGDACLSTQPARPHADSCITKMPRNGYKHAKTIVSACRQHRQHRHDAGHDGDPPVRLLMHDRTQRIEASPQDFGLFVHYDQTQAKQGIANFPSPWLTAHEQRKPAYDTPHNDRKQTRFQRLTSCLPSLGISTAWLFLLPLPLWCPLNYADCRTSTLLIGSIWSGHFQPSRARPSHWRRFLLREPSTKAHQHQLNTTPESTFQVAASSVRPAIWKRIRRVAETIRHLAPALTRFFCDLQTEQTPSLSTLTAANTAISGMPLLPMPPRDPSPDGRLRARMALLIRPDHPPKGRLFRFTCGTASLLSRFLKSLRDWQIDRMQQIQLAYQGAAPAYDHATKSTTTTKTTKTTAHERKVHEVKPFGISSQCLVHKTGDPLMDPADIRSSMSLFTANTNSLADIGRKSGAIVHKRHGPKNVTDVNFGPVRKRHLSRLFYDYIAQLVQQTTSATSACQHAAGEWQTVGKKRVDLSSSYRRT